jgi:hypothetical protein
VKEEVYETRMKRRRQKVLLIVDTWHSTAGVFVWDVDNRTLIIVVSLTDGASPTMLQPTPGLSTSALTTAALTGPKLMSTMIKDHRPVCTW